MKPCVCICGGGSLGHVVAGFLAAKSGVEVNVLTRRPALWQSCLAIYTPSGETLNAPLRLVTASPAEALDGVSIVLLCLPGYALRPQLEQLKPHLHSGIFVGSVFSSTGFFFEAMNLLPADIPLWGFQRVPFIARTAEYGKSAYLLGYKQSHNIAVERCCRAQTARFRAHVEQLFAAPVYLLANYYEASFTNSNPILHPARLYSLFRHWQPGEYFSRNPFFYEDWTDEASQYLIQLDAELFVLLAQLPVQPNFLQPILPYYESTDAPSLTRKIRSIASFKGITSPMVQTPQGWLPDLASRYFQEDFNYGLRYICQEAARLNVTMPLANEILEWGEQLFS